MRSSTTAFLDTNILLHYPPLSEIDWKALCQAGTVGLVICLQVIEELDDKKCDPHLGTRARQRIREIRELRSSATPLRDGITLAVFNEQLRNDEFPRSLSPDSGDDRIVRFVQKYQAAHPEEVVGVVTEDLGMELRCEAHGLPVFHPDATKRLSVPADELTRKLREAQNEIAGLKNRQPQFALRAVPDNLNPKTTELFEAGLREAFEILNVDAELESQRKQYGPERRLHRGRTIGVESMGRLLASEDEWKRYDRELEAYFVQYAEFVRNRNSWSARRAKCLEFKLWLGNTGRGPATDIDLSITFPQRFSAFRKSDRAGEVGLTEPKPPRLPEGPRRTIAQLVRPGSLFSEFRSPASHGIAAGRPASPEAYVYDNGELGLGIHAVSDRIKHAKWRFIGQFIAEFDSWDDVGTFEATYEITAAELPQATTGKPVFKVERGR